MRVLMTADAVGGVWTYALELARALAPHGVALGTAHRGQDGIEPVDDQVVPKVVRHADPGLRAPVLRVVRIRG